MTTISSTSLSLTAASTTTPQLVKTANGEYTAASVSNDPSAANSLGLIKEQDGNYGTTTPVVASNGSVASQSTSSVLAALISLTRGGN